MTMPVMIFYWIWAEKTKSLFSFILEQMNPRVKMEASFTIWLSWLMLTQIF